jgi:pimeloyl-ACP methyl ester carboxylesterase
LYALLESLELTDVALVGFSMGTGEVTRYLGSYGSGRVSKAVLIGAIPPFLLKTADNPQGVDRSVFEGIKQAITADRPAYLKDFLDDFYNVDVLGGTRVSEPDYQASFNVAAAASAFASWACVDTWLTDFPRDRSRWPAQHRLDPPRDSEPGPARLHLTQARLARAGLACAWLWQPAHRRVCGCGNVHSGVCRLPLPYNSASVDINHYGRNAPI